MCAIVHGLGVMAITFVAFPSADDDCLRRLDNIREDLSFFYGDKWLVNLLNLLPFLAIVEWS